MQQGKFLQTHPGARLENTLRAANRFGRIGSTAMLWKNC